MDWHPVISVQPQTPDNDFCHFSISDVRFAFLAFFRKPEKLVSHTGSKWWPGDPDVKDNPNDPLTRWPNDPVPCLVSTATTWCAQGIQTYSTLQSLQRDFRELSWGYQPRPRVVDRGTTTRYGGQLGDTLYFVIVINITYICPGDRLWWCIPSGSLPM